MASSLGSLVVRLGLDAADYTAALTKAEAAAARFAGQTEQSMRRVSKSTDETARAIGTLKNAFAGIAAGIGVQELVKLGDEYQNVNARLSIFTSSTEELANLQKRLFAISQNTRQSLAATSDLYYQLANATQDVGTSQADLLNITQGINKALIISGAVGSSAKGAIIQLSQALGAGKLRGQEFNTVNEQGNRIMRALAQGLGKTVAELRDMANAGELTTELFIRGFTKGIKDVEKEFEKMPVTITGALQIAQNEIQRFIGTQVQTAGQTTPLAQGIITLAKNIDILTAAALGYGITKLSSIFLTQVTAMEASAAATLSNAAAARANLTVARETAVAEAARLTATNAVIVAARAKTTADLQGAAATAAQATAMRAYIANLILQADAQTAASTSVVANNAAQVAAINAANEAHKARLRTALAGYEAQIVASKAATTALISDLALLGTAQTANNAKLAAGAAGAAASIGILQRAMNGISGAITFLGGPIGAITLALGLGATAWQVWQSRASAAADAAAANMEKSTRDILASLDKQIEKLKLRNLLSASGQKEIAQAGGEGAERAGALLKRINDLKKSTDRSDQVLLIDLQGQYDDLIKALKTVRDEQDKVDDRGRAAKYAAYLAEYASDAEKLAAALKKAREELGDKFTPELEKRIRDKFTKKGGAKGGIDDPTRKIFDGQIKALESYLAKERDLLASRESFLRDTFSEGLLSVNSYYDNLQQAREENLRNAIGAYDLEIAAAEKLKAGLKREQDKQDAQNRIDDFRAKQANLIRDAAAAQENADRDRKRAAQEYSDQLSELNAKMLELQGNTAAAAAIRFGVANRQFNNLLGASGNTEGLEMNRILGEQAVIQARLADKSKEYGLILGQLDIAQERLNIQRGVGGISEVENLTRLSELNKTYAAQLRKVAEEYAAIAAASKDPADVLKVQQLTVAIEKLEAQTDLLGDKFNQIFATEFSQALQDVVNGTKSVKDAFLDMAKSITKAINQIAANSLADALFGKGGSASGTGSFFSSLFGTGSGGFDFSKILGMLFGGGGGGLGYGTIGSNIPAGPFPYATGTSFHPGGLALVGEQGPELLNLPRGSKVTPAAETKRLMNQGNMVFNVNVLPGANTASAKQAGAMLRDTVMRAIKDR